MEVSSGQLWFMGLLDLGLTFVPYLLLGLGVMIGIIAILPKRKDRD